MEPTVVQVIYRVFFSAMLFSKKKKIFLAYFLQLVPVHKLIWNNVWLLMKFTQSDVFSFSN